MHAKIEVTIKFDGDKGKGHKMVINVPNVQSKWLRKDVRNMDKWQALMFDSVRTEFPRTT